MVNIPVIFCFDDRILLGAGVSILSMLDAAQETTIYDIHIFNPGFPAGIKADLRQLVDGTRHTMAFHEIPAARFADVPKGRGSWTEIVYYRMIASEVLPDVDKAIYSDVDVFFCQDMKEVFQTGLDGHEWAGVVAEGNTPENVMHKHFPENTNDMIVFSGFMVMNLALMRRNNAVPRYFAGIKEFGDRLRFFDLDLLNITTPSIGHVPFNYVVLEEVFETPDVTQSADFRYLRSVYSADDLTAARDDPAIIHYAGRRGKPWQRQDMPAYYKRVADRLPKGLRRFNFRSFRKKWLSRKGYRTFVKKSDRG